MLLISLLERMPELRDFAFSWYGRFLIWELHDDMAQEIFQRFVSPFHTKKK